MDQVLIENEVDTAKLTELVRSEVAEPTSASMAGFRMGLRPELRGGETESLDEIIAEMTHQQKVLLWAVLTKTESELDELFA